VKYAVEMGSSAMLYIPGFIKIWSGIAEVVGKGVTHTDTDREVTP
jgi:hypothetical protein